MNKPREIIAIVETQWRIWWIFERTQYIKCWM